MNFIVVVILFLQLTIAFIFCSPTPLRRPGPKHNPDCDGINAVKKMVRLCNDYHGRSNLFKREAKVTHYHERNTFPGIRINKAFNNFFQQAIESVNLRLNEHPHHVKGHEKSFQTINVPSGAQSDTHDSPPLDPEELGQYNLLVLNPVNYDDEQDEEAKERWKRHGNLIKEFTQWVKHSGFSTRIERELFNFFIYNCCGDEGCLYPEQFAQLDDRIHFCVSG